LALKHVDLNRSLTVGSRRKDFRLARRYRRVALDQLGENAAERFDAEAQRSHIEQKQILDLAAEHPRLNPSAYGDHLIRVYALMRLAAEELLNHLLNLRYARRSSNQHYFVDLVLR